MHTATRRQIIIKASNDTVLKKIKRNYSEIPESDVEEGGKHKILVVLGLFHWYHLWPIDGFYLFPVFFEKIGQLRCSLQYLRNSGSTTESLHHLWCSEYMEYIQYYLEKDTQPRQ